VVRRFPSTDAAAAALAVLAKRQYGVVTRAQLISLGARTREIDRLLDAGHLHRLHAGVYALGHVAPRREAKWLAAVLACGDGAVLSHRSAATLWRIRDGEGPHPDVTVPLQRRPRHPKVAVRTICCASAIATASRPR
jgi:Transcriptional regulator, AbiEi antitoxin